VNVRRPRVDRRLGLGVGLDLPWGAPIGFATDPARGDVVTDRVVRFLSAHADDFGYLLASWQPRGRGRLDPREYHAAFDDLFARAPRYRVRALHHTALNLGALERYDRAELIDFTNALVERYDFAWVNEDVGLWSLHGRPLPYPLPPYLTDAGLAACVRNTNEVQRALAAPLVLEFPGFSEGASFCIGRAHAYDYFRRLAEDTGSPVTLDVGHLLSYQWMLGRRGEALYAELDRLPLAHAFEIHLSGCTIDRDRFFDHHHGVLLDEQVELLTRLLPLCPNARAVTYEDPKFADDGALIRQARENFSRVRTIATEWAA